MRILAGNAYRILVGDLTVTSVNADASGAALLSGGYDLIYSADLYDYIPDGSGGAGGAPALTRVLFSLLNPGGLLLVGNYLKPTPASGHQEHVRAMMELYSHWCLRYRSADQIAGFASTIHGPHTVNLLDESGRPHQYSARAASGSRPSKPPDIRKPTSQPTAPPGLSTSSPSRPGSRPLMATRAAPTDPLALGPALEYR